MQTAGDNVSQEEKSSDFYSLDPPLIGEVDFQSRSHDPARDGPQRSGVDSTEFILYVSAIPLREVPVAFVQPGISLL